MSSNNQNIADSLPHGFITDYRPGVVWWEIALICAAAALIALVGSGIYKRVKTRQKKLSPQQLKFSSLMSMSLEDSYTEALKGFKEFLDILFFSGTQNLVAKSLSELSRLIEGLPLGPELRRDIRGVFETGEKLSYRPQESSQQTQNHSRLDEAATLISEIKKISCTLVENPALWRTNGGKS